MSESKIVSKVYEWAHIVGGMEIGVIRRFLTEGPKGLKKIDIPYYTKDGDEWKKGIPEEYKPYPLFGIDSFRNIHQALIICEGQKTAEAWRGLGYQVVTNIIGSSSIEETDWTSIRDAKHVWQSPDNDEPGKKAAEQISHLVRDFGAVEESDHRILHLPVKEGGDVCDWLKLQPELKDWNELDPLDDHPKREVIRQRLDNLIENKWTAAGYMFPKQEEWQDPANIETRLRPVKRLPKALIHPLLADWVLDTQRRMGCPLEYLGIGSLSMLSTALGATLTVRPKKRDTWAVVPNTFANVTGPVSTMKSPALEAMIEPLRCLDSTQFENYEKEKEEHKKKKFAYDMQLNALKDRGRSAAKGKQTKINQHLEETPEDVAQNLPDEPPAPTLKRFIMMDTTMQAVTQTLADNEQGIMLYVDELAGLLKTWDQEGRQSDRPFILTGWNGNQAYTVDRATKEQQRIKRLCISILGGMQPDTLRRYLIESGDDLNDGLMQRFQLMIYLDREDIGEIEGDDQEEDYDAKMNVRAIVKAMTETNWVEYGAQQPTDKESLPYFRFSDEAQELYQQWEQELKQKIHIEENPYVQQHLDKYRSLMPSLALTFHALEIAARIRTGPISVESAQLAAFWCEFLEQHARRVYEMGKPYEMARVMTLAKQIKKGKLKRAFAPWEVQRKCWRGLKKGSDIKEACRQLCELNWLRQITQQNKRGGPPKIEFLVNPLIEFSC